MKSHYQFLSLGTVLVIAICMPLRGDPPAARNFQAQHMTGDQEVPPRDSPAHGVAVFNLSPDGNEWAHHFWLFQRSTGRRKAERRPGQRHAGSRGPASSEPRRRADE